jgi:DNA-binding NarL/FixJ family response regulator
VVILTADNSALSREMTVSGGSSTYLLKHDLTPDRLQNALRQAVAEWPTSQSPPTEQPA